jgi:uncharacterized protein (TIGR03067 family)
VVTTIINTKYKHVLAVMLGVSALAGAAVLIGQAQAAEQPQTKEAQPAKTDQERIVGNWFIMNDDSQRRGEMWLIDKDHILMNPMHGGINANLYSHRLDAGQDPKQIDITVTQVNGTRIGVIKGLYALDGDELRLCLASMCKDRPAAFPNNKLGPGEVLILHRTPKPQVEEQAAAKKDEPQKATKEPEVLAPSEAIKQKDKE